MKNLLGLIGLLFLFSIVQAQNPSISSLSPAFGPVGAQVVITGTNFSTTPSDNTVYFGAVKARVSAATATSLTVSVPLGATYSPVSVAVNKLVASSRAPFAVTYTGGGLAFSAASFAPAASYGGNGSVTSGDFDGDGKVDVVSTDFSNNLVTVHRNTTSGSGVSFAPVPLGGAINPLSTQAADLDGDGDLDLVVSGYYWGVVYVFKNNSSPGVIIFDVSQWFAAANGTRKITTGDIDGDGRVDIVASNEGANSISVLRNTTSGTTISFAPKVDYPTGLEPEGITTGDLDGDGKVEVVVACKRSDAVSLFRNTSTAGSISLAAKTDLPTGGYPWEVAAVDIDGDGKPEVLTSNSTPDNVSVFRNTSTPGTLSFAGRADFGTSYSPKGMTVGDLDADGKAEIVTGNSYFSNEVCVLRNTSAAGTLSFQNYVMYPVGDGVIGVAVADFNEDGLSDVMTANSRGRSLSFLRNQLPIATNIPTCPQLLSPANNAVLPYGLPQELKWRKQPNATGYKLRITLQQTGAVTEVTTTDTSYVLPLETGGLNYSWSVTPLNMLDPDAVCSSFTFRTCAATPATVTISAEGAADKCSYDSVRLSASPAASLQWFFNNRPIAGATAEFFWAKDPGSYTVREVSGSCYADPSNAVIVTNLATPAQPVLNVSGATTFCQGGSVTLAGAQANATYQWFRNAAALDGGTTERYTVGEPGSYYLRVSNSSTGCRAFSDTVSVVVNALPARPAVTITSGVTTFCSGDSVVLSSSATSNNQWYKNNALLAGATARQLTIREAGAYTVRATQNTCSSEFSEAVNVVVNPTPATPGITVSGSTIFCAGDSAMLQSSVATGIQWYKDNAPLAAATAQILTVKEAGAYTVTAVGSLCSSPKAEAIRITTHPLPAKPVITGTANLLSTASGLTAYKWYLNNTVLGGATAYQYAPTQAGLYKVEVADERGCKAVSDPYNFVVTALNEVTFAGYSIQVYPNPVVDEVTIRVSGGSLSLRKFTATVAGVGGSALKTVALKSGLNSLSLKELPAGIYNLVIAEGRSVQAVKLFKVH